MNKVISNQTVEENLSSKMEEIKTKEIEQEVEAKAKAQHIPYLNLQNFPVSLETLELIPEDKAKELKLVPLLRHEHEIRLGACNPLSPDVEFYVGNLKKKYPGHYQVYIISPHSFDLAFKFYKRLSKPVTMQAGVRLTEADLKRYQGVMKDFKGVNELMASASLTDLVAVVIAGALEMRASDIHIEAEADDVKIRYRIDGTLYIVAELNKDRWPKLISRLKLLSKLKLNVQQEPQDGRFTIFLSQDAVDVRVSTIPTTYGESVVMRLLKSSAAGLAYEDLGLIGKAYEDLKREVERPNGMIITTGPTGSGKTTTLYAILNKLNDSKTKIITLEDPVEYKLKGINQSQIDHASGYDFAKGLRSILRQDPDVVMVGEIRDFETADIAVNAALTGHLVVSTIHTNSAAGAIPRFLAMGVKPFLMAPALNCIIGQRLVRRLCDKCKQPNELNPEQLARVEKALSEIPTSARQPKKKQLTFYKGQGCEACNHLGYKGRIGIYEIMVFSPEMEQLILSGQTSEYTLQDLAVKQGMLTMLQDGILKALDGITSIEEIFSVAE